MSDLFERMGLNKNDFKKYKSNSEYISDEFKQKYTFIRSYLKCKEKGNFKEQRKKALENLYCSQGMLRLYLKASEYADFFASGHVKKIYKLNEIEWFVLVIAMMYHADEKYKRAILSIENSERLTYNAILKLYFFTDDIAKIKGYQSILYSCSQKMNSLCFMNGRPEIDNRLFENIMSNFNSEMKIPGLELHTVDDYDKTSLLIRDDTAIKISKFLVNSGASIANCVCLCGENGIGKRAMINRICGLENKGIVYIDLGLPENSDFAEIVLTGCREALMREGYICLHNFKKLSQDSKNDFSCLYPALDLAKRFSKVIFVISEEKINIFPKASDMNYLNVFLPELSNEESIKLWEHGLKNVKMDKNLSISELASKFTFTPAQINNTVIEAVMQSKLENREILDSAMLSTAAYNQVTSNLSDKATLIRKKHTWDELVLNLKEKEVLKQACNQIRYRHIVYGKWGMEKRILYGKGLSMLFSGASGTGKTMASQVIANELGLEIYKVDLSRVISKYIGESEKNIGEIFDNAKKSNVILLFDETDALFAKRTEVKDSHDRNANLETSYLLQKMEEHSGITIMTTNFLENIDKAFFRRINYVVHFSFPDIKSRKEIWKKMYPKEMPLAKDVDFDFLSRQFEISGGSIKNVALSSAFMAAAENKKVGMKHIIKALEYEIGKQGKIVSKDDFAEYGYLL